ncbi:VOC family protein [Streptomyces sp. NBC_01239]|uniref:VOC family protein n=1 Tax=Streptomyces sp. NBC_01239 TaxID=2903792 RepID=UPI002257F5E9|nr:VOC family protein [Streptomyces sp. NBC_01239]MCX4817121.1 VOC family protein [Streptomyces sp. NBC_01239]
MALVNASFLVLDAVDPEKLAAFYTELLDGEQTDISLDQVEIRGADGTRLAFRRDLSATPPLWPRSENNQQVHLDFLVEDLDEAERRIVGLGGRPVETKDMPGPHEERIYADPAGHTFTLRPAPGTAADQI